MTEKHPGLRIADMRKAIKEIKAKGENPYYDTDTLNIRRLANKEAKFVQANMPKSVRWIIATYPRKGKPTPLDRRAVKEYIRQRFKK